MSEARVIAAKLPISTTKGDSQPFSLVVRNRSTLDPINITGATGRMQLRKIIDNSLAITLTTSDDLSILTGTDGRVTIDPTNINLLDSGDYKYDIQLTISGVKRTYIKGIYTVDPESTED